VLESIFTDVTRIRWPDPLPIDALPDAEPVVPLIDPLAEPEPPVLPVLPVLPVPDEPEVLPVVPLVDPIEEPLVDPLWSNVPRTSTR